MKMIPGSGDITNYTSYISDCTQGQMPYKIPVNSLSDVQLYINIGATKPDAVEYQMIRTCGYVYNTLFIDVEVHATNSIYFSLRGALHRNQTVTVTLYINGSPTPVVYVSTVQPGWNKQDIYDDLLAQMTPNTNLIVDIYNDGVRNNLRMLAATTLTGTIEMLGPTEPLFTPVTPGQYLVTQDTNGNWYGVFKNFTGTPTFRCFVIAITLTIGGSDQIYFSEEYCVKSSCDTLVLLQGCYGHPDNLIAYDCNGIYFGTPQGALIGDPTTLYTHQLLLRKVEVSLEAIKNSFKQGRTRNFRTEKEKIFQFWAEFIPEWYLPEIDAVFSRGEVYVGATRYLISETQFEKVEECMRMWNPAASFKESCYQSFSCETDPCGPPVTECCDPVFVSYDVTEVSEESGFPIGSGDSGSGISPVDQVGIVVVQGVVDGPVSVTGTFDPVSGLTIGSSLVSCAAFAGARVFVERGNLQIPGIDPLDGSQYYTKIVGSTDIIFSTPLVSSEFIYIQTIP